MSKAARITYAVSTAGALLGTLGTGVSQSGPGVPGVPGVSDHVIAMSRSAILRYWTVRRMTRALTPPDRVLRRPVARPPRTSLTVAGALPPKAPVAATGAPAPASPATPLAVGGALPPASPLAVGGALPPASPLAVGGALSPGRRSAQGPRTPWASPGAVRATTGKVFFTIDGADYVCSAGTVDGANHDLVITAGHCVQNAAGVWARNWIYVPGYDQGRRPYGAFTARRMFAPTAWSGRHDENHDVAMVALATADGRHVTDVVGAQDIAFDQPRGTVAYGFGYPTGGRYDGERLAYCSGRTHPDAHRLTQDQGLRCDMSEGASGGPWLTRFDARTGVGVVTSVNSFKYSDDPATMYGPYFGAAVHRIYEEAQRA
ncbi:trypsin-like serine peptidase [Actinoallomurus rhizosphaericola]|uniref:trypsin-like serine peptidase n=1 Tax=Actinoallomurus rhizosphaericola TaxID=2952536 RepID=UPI0020908D80|nr:trypsin-like peptidase domain-containing protein [Actinoallomurus rhizosphaericola]MCO5992186.1 trypsin-like peptidase domain-containing protein [Actinoallomurus rhizosphaericola]